MEGAGCGAPRGGAAKEGAPKPSAGSTVPRHSPKPMRTAPGFSHQPRRITASPSSRKARSSPRARQRDGPLAALTQFDQRASLGWRRAGDRAAAEQVAGLQVAAADRVVRDHLRDGPVLVAKARLREPRRADAGGAARRGFDADLEPDVERAVRAGRGGVEVRQRLRERGVALPRTRNGASASIVTIHGETVVAKFLPRNGPSGAISQAWMSRADQSLSRQMPNTWLSACASGTGLPSALPVPTKMPSSSS